MVDPSRPRLNVPPRVGGDGEPEVFCADEQRDLPVDLERWQALAANVLRVEGGAQLVDEAGRKMEQIVESIRGVNEIVADAKKSGDLDKLAVKWLGRPAGDLPQ